MFFLFDKDTVPQPISDINSVSPTQLGNKAYRCCQLFLKNFNVPRSLVLPVDLYEAHIRQLGLQEQIDIVLKNPSNASTSASLEIIRQSIQSSSLSEKILTGIRSFISMVAIGVAVRSSALLEDTSSHSAAGQYATTLNCTNLDEIERAVLRCWSSLWTPNSFNYIKHTLMDNSTPKIAVLIMEMIKTVKSGVVFTENPVTGADEIVIEAVWGLGMDLVSGKIDPDRFIFDSHLIKIHEEITYKPFQYNITSKPNQIDKEEVPCKNRERPVLSDAQMKDLCSTIKSIACLYGKAQDIEWAIDAADSLWIVQSRDITSTVIPLPAFLPPGPGEWRIIDHIAHPGSRCFAEYYYSPMEAGWNEEAEEIGTLNRVKIREVNGFMYYQMESLDSEQQYNKMCQVNEGYWEEKRFLSMLQRWDKIVKPSVSNQLMALQKTKLEQLSTDRLIEHIEGCFRVTQQMVKTHHRFTYTAFIPVGDFIKQVSDWTRKDAVDVLDALRGSSSSRLFMAEKIPIVQKMFVVMQKSATALYLLSKVDQEPENARKILAELLSCDGCIEQGLHFILENYGYRIVNGYDITAETFIERPDLLLRAVKSTLYLNLGDNHKTMQTLRGLTPDEKKQLFDELLSDAREMQRLRDERGMYSDLWAIGILRHAFLEAGKRLSQKEIIDLPELILDATHQETIALLKGELAVSAVELKRRADYRSHHSVIDAPAILGLSPVSSANLPHLPPSMARTMDGLGTAIFLAVEHMHVDAKQQDILIGTPASKGIVEGMVRVIQSDYQINEIKRGDILVVLQTTTVFNVILPLVGGIIAQFGGILSHPAILAREYGIPCIVGCSNAMEHLRTGMSVCLDGNKGEVKIISKSDDITQRLESLRCEYYGPMRGRNRDRIFNHLDDVSSRFTLVKEIRRNEESLDLLRKHFHGEMPSDEAADQIIKQLQQVAINISREQLEQFVKRLHVEFHPCDACNLRCSGCTYFQDTPSRPSAKSFPFENISRICKMMQPKAITLVGGGEPTLYKSGQHKLGDLICALGQGEFGCTPAIGLISNGVLWPMGNQQWTDYVSWIRYSLDASTSDSYLRSKGKNYFDRIIENIFRTLSETAIPQVGVGFLYHPGNIAEAGLLISLLANRLKEICPAQLARLNIQFRPWRIPVGHPSIQEHILSDWDIKQAATILFRYIEQDHFLEQFTRNNTNIAVNLLCGGAREGVKPFSECFFGLAKTVIRTDGSLYPCFRMGASKDSLFYCGNILTDTLLSIALRELYVAMFSAQQICVPDYDKCFFCIFNNALEAGINNQIQPEQELAGDYFF
jgi:rifampicin phosphotransferase